MSQSFSPQLSVSNGFRKIATLVLTFAGLTLHAGPQDICEMMETKSLTAWHLLADATDAAIETVDERAEEAALVALACRPRVNVSLGEQGFAIITPGMLVLDPQYPPGSYTVDIVGPLTNTVYCAQLGQELMVVVNELPTGNSCMSTIKVEDKLKPVFACTPDVVPCNVDIFSLNFRDYLEPVTDNCDPDPDLWYSYTIQNLACNPNNYTQQVNVTWTATDQSGNKSTCTDILYLVKPTINQVQFPPNTSVSCGSPNTLPAVTGEPTYNGAPIGQTCQIVSGYSDTTIPMCSGSFKVQRLWRVVDWCTGQQLTKLQEILVVDNVPPVLTCPASITLGTDPGVCTRKYTLPAPTVSDACAPANQIDIKIWVTGIPGFFAPGHLVTLGLGISTITIRATDPCGNSSTCNYLVTVRDNTSPLVFCPANVTIQCTGDTSPASTGTATAKDICDLSPIVSYTDATASLPNCANAYRITRTWLAVDHSGNSAMCMQLITLSDTQSPNITCPPNVTIACGSSTAPPGTGGSATATDLCDPSPTITFTDFTLSGSCPQEYIIQRNWVASDDCGNSRACRQVILVVDEIAPAITCPPDITIMCNESSDPANTGAPTVTDNCDPSPSVTFTDVTLPNGPQSFMVERTWRVVDGCGNSSSCLQQISVVDDSPPVFLTCPENITIECTEEPEPPLTGQPNVSDCDPAVSISYVEEVVPGNCPQEYTVMRTWIATDESGNTSSCAQVITIDDSTPPLITCPANRTIECTASTLPANTGTASATDNCDGAAVITFADITLAGNCPQERTINRTWIAIDDCGNSSSCLQVILVEDNTAPAMTCPANVTIACTASTLPASTGSATATDTCDPGVVPTYTDVTNGGGCPQAFVITRTWRATDDCGNSTTCTQIITVQDNVAPVITCPANTTIECNANTLPANTGSATANDACDPGVVPTFSDVTAGGPCPQGYTITRTWRAVDDCGNSSSCVQVIAVRDMTAPVITCPAAITIACTASTLPANTGVASALDNCDPSVVPTFSDVTLAGSCPQERTINRTWTAIDDCGNITTCLQVIVVDDSAPPSIACPSNVTIACSANTLPASTGFPTATDNCDTAPSITYSDVITGGPCPQEETITRTWVATDACGNSASCVQIILVDDNVAPTILCPANVTIQCTASTLPANTGSASAIDVCDATPTITFLDATIGGACPQTATINRTWMATDDCGNVNTCLQTISRIDTNSPICVTQDITVTLNGSGTVTITASQVNNGSSDACGPVTLAVSPNTFTCDDLGANIVTLTVTDCAGNASSCTAVVTVTEGSGIQANCQNVTVFLDSNGNATVDPSQVNNGSGGGCNPGMLEFDLSQTQFSCFNIGQNLVVLTVTDENGNTATCTAIVTVIDNLPPSLTCPPNLTVDCHVVTDPNNTAQFGNATALDNCPPASVSETHVINLNNCNVGTITRTFVATDGSGNSTSCVQVVTVVNPDPFDQGDITWPASPVNVNICNSTLPQNIPNGQPTFNQNALICANISVSFSDVVDVFVDNNPATPCRVISRTWTVTNNCTPVTTFTFVQIINVTDSQPPVFTNINDMTKTANASTCTAPFTLIANATDCAGVTITNNSPYGATTGANASGNYPVGQTTVIFTATDGCGNTATMDVVLTVLDPDPTEFQCEKVIIFLPPETEVTLHADTFVIFLEGACTSAEDFIVSFSNTNPYDTLKTYDCGDVGVSTFPLYFWMVGNPPTLINTCPFADLDLRDPNDFCQDGLVVAGGIGNENGLPLEGVEVTVANAPMHPDMTDAGGRYWIDGFAGGSSYDIRPRRDINPKEGVSTLDLVMIQKHLLGKARLNSPYKLIAADANRSGNLTALDLIEIRKLILGIYTRFPNNTSWRFVDKAFSFPDPYNPFATAFPEEVWLDSIVGLMDTVDFVAVKVGDVNGSFFAAKGQGNPVEGRSAMEYGLSIVELPVLEGEARTFELRAVEGQPALDGLQFSLDVGPLSTDLALAISSDFLNPDQYHYDPVSGFIRVAFAAQAPVVPEGQALLRWKTGQQGDPAFRLHIGDLLPEAYIAAETTPDVWRAKLGPTDYISKTVAMGYALFQNIPNPFSDATLIRFTLPAGEHVRISVYDQAGRQVYTTEHEGVAGMNEIRLAAGLIRHPGLYYYTLHTAQASFTRKMSYTAQ